VLMAGAASCGAAAADSGENFAGRLSRDRLLQASKVERLGAMGVVGVEVEIG
jgi:hypothetical protein